MGKPHSVTVVNPTVVREKLIVTLADPTVSFDLEDFCLRQHCSKMLVRELLRDPELNKEVRAQVKEAVGGGAILSQIYAVFVDRALRGSFKHGKLLFEMTGEYVPNLKITPDVQSIEAKFKQLEAERDEERKRIAS